MFRQTLTFLLLLNVTSCGPGPTAVAANPDYVVVRLMHRTASNQCLPQAFSINSNTYYADKSIVINLAHCDFATAGIIRDNAVSGGRAISIRTTRGGRIILEQYTKGHLGERLGVFVGGKLLCAPVIVRSFGEGIIISKKPPFTVEEARKTRDVISRGGE
jgi:preprotein translocase subunit SecD